MNRPKDCVKITSVEGFRVSVPCGFPLWILTSVPQQILNVSQEGGHHPRFNQETLENLSIDKNRYVTEQENISRDFKNSIKNLRSGEQGVLKLLQKIDA